MKAGAIIVLLLAPATGASQDFDRAAAYFQRYDSDRDGRVSEQEFVEYLSVGFDALDRDGDGRLDAHELTPGARLRRPRSRDDHQAALRAAFHRQDRDRDGVLDRMELAAPPP